MSQPATASENAPRALTSLTDEERLFRQSVGEFATSQLRPLAAEMDEQGKFSADLIKQFFDLGLMGIAIPEQYGGQGGNFFTSIIAVEELSRADASAGVIVDVQNTLVNNALLMWANEDQKRRYLPRLATDTVGAYALSEAGSGSDAFALATKAEDKGDHYLLNGAKMWISNSPKADVAVVWAKNEAGRIHGLILERGMAGFSTPETHGKWSLRASTTGELVFDNVKVPKENLLPGKSGLGAPLMCLDSARYGIAWGALGAAMDCYDSARRYAMERIQFGKPIASFQLMQKKLAEMLTEITKAQLLNWRLGVLMNEGKATTPQISMAKRNSVQTALEIAREARQIHGGMGITGEYPIMRHMMNLESVMTYEGTHDIHLLILGNEITGISAFV